jgi:hypothetical protein
MERFKKFESFIGQKVNEGIDTQRLDIIARQLSKEISSGRYNDWGMTPEEFVRERMPDLDWEGKGDNNPEDLEAAVAFIMGTSIMLPHVKKDNPE